MIFSLSQLLFISGLYLFTLFSAAWTSEQGWLPKRLTEHPLVYVLSLGVYASAWAFYGSVGLAHQYNYGFLAIYLGISGAFILAPVLLYPFLQLTRTHQLSSLADVFAFRFRSHWVGSITTLGLLIGCLPLLTLQIQAVVDSVHLLNPQVSSPLVGLIFCITICLFTIIFGARNVTTRQKHHGLVFAIAFESLLKTIALLLIGGFLLLNVFDGLSGVDQWLIEHQALLSRLHTPLQEGPWRTLLLIFFASAIVMPHMYHMTFTENITPRSMFTASWGMPLLMLLVSLPIPLILWAGIKLGVTTKPQFFTLGIGLALNNPKLALLAYVGGLSAASGVIIILTLALAGMVLNHLILPFYQPSQKQNIYRWLRGVRRWLIIAIIAASYLFYYGLRTAHSLSQLGLVSFVATLQFLPAALAVLYWPRANRTGFIVGVLAGLTTWFVGLLLPIFIPLELLGLASYHFSDSITENSWHLAAIIALSVNCLCFISFSLLSRTSEEELRAAKECSIDPALGLAHNELHATSPQAFASALSQPLGAVIAQRETQQALTDLGYSFDERRPFALRRLREQLTANLSGLMGPSVAQGIINSFIPYKKGKETYQNEDIHLIETRLEEYQLRLTGLAAELDTLRRYHRQTLQDLPLGVCSLAKDQEIFMWNHALEKMTGISSSRVVGANLNTLDEPWRSTLVDFISDQQAHWYKFELRSHYESRTLNLHKAAIDEAQALDNRGMVLLVEDITETRKLEDTLIHSERLASIGRLAAGVAHEIGNPITGIACLTQNLQEDYPNDPEILENCGLILEQTQRVTRIVKSLMGFSHSGKSHSTLIKQPVFIRQACNEAIALILLNRDSKAVEFNNHCDSQHFVQGDQQRLIQVFVNLLSNARDASPANGQITITSQLDSQYLNIFVEDQGEGLSKIHHERLFEPFFTTKDPGKGTGLGLAMVFSIIEEHQGTIEVVSPSNTLLNNGTRFCIYLPIRALVPANSFKELSFNKNLPLT